MLLWAGPQSQCGLLCWPLVARLSCAVWVWACVEALGWRWGTEEHRSQVKVRERSAAWWEEARSPGWGQGTAWSGRWAFELWGAGSGTEWIRQTSPSKGQRWPVGAGWVDLVTYGDGQGTAGEGCPGGLWLGPPDDSGVRPLRSRALAGDALGVALFTEP